MMSLAKKGEKCFACGRTLGINPYHVVTEGGQLVHVGSECYKLIKSAKAKGYRPPSGGPKLYRGRFSGVTLLGKMGEDSATDASNPIPLKPFQQGELYRGVCPKHGVFIVGAKFVKNIENPKVECVRCKSGAPATDASNPIPINETKLSNGLTSNPKFVELEDRRNGKTIIDWWDDDVDDALEDGFLRKGDLHGSAYQYARSLNLLPSRTENKGDSMPLQLTASDAALLHKVVDVAFDGKKERIFTRDQLRTRIKKLKGYSVDTTNPEQRLKLGKKIVALESALKRLVGKDSEAQDGSLTVKLKDGSYSVLCPVPFEWKDSKGNYQKGKIKVRVRFQVRRGILDHLYCRP